MSGLYERYQTDPQLEKETGVLLNYGANSKGKDFCIRILRAGGSNVAFEKRRDQITKPYRRQLQTENMDPVLLKNLLKELYASNVVIGWENAEDRDGNDLPFTKENVLKIFEDLGDIWDDVYESAQKSALFRAQVREEDAKN